MTPLATVHHHAADDGHALEKLDSVEFDPEKRRMELPRLALGEWADCYLIAPATGQHAGQNGQASRTTCRSRLIFRHAVRSSWPRPDLIWPPTRRRAGTCGRSRPRRADRGAGRNELASDLRGKGRMAEAGQEIAAFVGDLPGGPSGEKKKKSLAGKRMIVTAGGHDRSHRPRAVHLEPLVG